MATPVSRRSLLPFFLFLRRSRHASDILISQYRRYAEHAPVDILLQADKLVFVTETEKKKLQRHSFHDTERSQMYIYVTQIEIKLCLYELISTYHTFYEVSMRFLVITKLLNDCKCIIIKKFIHSVFLRSLLYYLLNY